MLIFPEGTRSKSKTLNPFKAGALQPAKLANVPYVFNNKQFQHEKTLQIIYGNKLYPTICKRLSYQEISDLITREIQAKLS